MKRLFLFLALALPLACQHNAQHSELAAGSWDAQVRNQLNSLLETYQDSGAYAVFDFDKTSIVHDVSQALWVYQVEHLRYADAPAHGFLDGIPDVSQPIGGITFAQMGEVLKEEYAQLAALQADGKTLEQIHATDTYKDFRARMATLLVKMDDVFGYEVSYLWMPGLLAGYTEAEAREVVHDAVLDQMGKEKLEVQEWTSPDGKWSTPVERGIWLSPEMKDLYHCLADNGITAYVCSASLELIVEVLACDPDLGVGLSPEQVFGLRFVRGDKLVAEYDPEYVQTIRDGKVTCIKTLMAPLHKDKGPILVGGDSNGDVPMLIAFEDTRHGLIIDVGRSPESKIGQLATQAREQNNTGRYLLQPNFAPIRGAVDGGGI
jgi:phosphoserine phosphatase